MVNSSGQFTAASSDTSILKFQPSFACDKSSRESWEVTQKSDIYSCQMRLLGETPCMCIMIIQRAFENPIQTLLLILISVLIFFTLQGWNKYLRTRLLPAPRSSGPGPDPNNRAAVCWKIHTFFIFQKTHVNGQGSYLYQDICCLGVENTGIGCFRFSLNVYLILNMIMIIINFPLAIYEYLESKVYWINVHW